MWLKLVSHSYVIQSDFPEKRKTTYICNTKLVGYILFGFLFKHTPLFPLQYAGHPEPRFSSDHNHGWCDCEQERLPHAEGVLPVQPLCGSHSR